MTGVRPPDEVARRAIREDLSRSLVCQAGAGAGKTQALVERMVACVRAGAADIGHMAAITFTRKAAGEMRGRFFLALQEAAQAGQTDGGAEGRRQARRLRDAVQRVDLCVVGTIHAFCARLLRERPVEAGLPPDFTEVEEREELWLARAAWDRFLEARSAAGDERWLAIEDTGLTAEQLYHFYLRRCQFSDLALKATNQARPDLEAAAAAAGGLVRQVDAQIPDPLPGDGPDELMGTVRRLRPLVDFAGPLSDADRERLLRELQSKTGTRVVLKCWGSPGSPGQALARRLRDQVLPALREQVLEPVLAQWRRYVYTLAAALADEAMGSYTDLRRAAATLTFNDLLEITAALLRDHPRVRVDFQRRYRRLFVDEFQDTDPLQAQILLYLTGQEVEERDWRRLTPAPGSLFLVGDEKQSIYRFRRADVDVFRAVRDRVTTSGGRLLELTASFRARPELTSWLNGAFESLFDSHDTRYQASFTALHATREKRQGAGVYRLRARADGGRREDQVRDEARRIAAFISGALAGNTALNGEGAVLGPRAAPGDFMILTRIRRHLSEYARALEARRIPYDITGVGSLRTSGELRALVDALECVLRADDPVALVAYLRGLLVGLGDDELYQLRRSGWTFRWPADAPGDLDGDLRARLQAALGQLRRLRHDLVTRPPAAALERFVEGSGLAALAAGGDAGSSRAGNLLRVLAMVRDGQGRRALTWPQIAAELRDLVEDEAFRVEEMTLETGRQDVVRVMNLHQAKGLEAPVVFLADPADSSAQRHAVEAHVSRLGECPYLAMAVTKPNRFQTVVLAEPAGWDEEAAEEARFLEAEELRLVYVAATRARDVLVVGARPGPGAWTSLGMALSEAPDLPVPAGEVAESPRPAAEPVDLAALRRTRQRSWEQAVQHSFELVAVTDEEEDLVLEGDPETRGRGRRYGTVVHRLFENAVLGRLGDGDEEAYVRELLRAEGLASRRLEAAALAALARFRQSEIWRELAQAGDQLHAEVPFAQGRERTVLRGVIDLVYRVTGGWKIVDYKTVRPHLGGDWPTDGAGEQLRRRYGTQLAAYADHWEKATGEPVVARGLWLAEWGWLAL